MRALGSNPSDREVDYLMRKMDRDGRFVTVSFCCLLSLFFFFLPFVIVFVLRAPIPVGSRPLLTFCRKQWNG
jgi:hypothetical protein